MKMIYEGKREAVAVVVSPGKTVTAYRCETVDVDASAAKVLKNLEGWSQLSSTTSEGY